MMDQYRRKWFGGHYSQEGLAKKISSQAFFSNVDSGKEKRLNIHTTGHFPSRFRSSFMRRKLFNTSKIKTLKWPDCSLSALSEKTKII